MKHSHLLHCFARYWVLGIEHVVCGCVLVVGTEFKFRSFIPNFVWRSHSFAILCIEYCTLCIRCKRKTLNFDSGRPVIRFQLGITFSVIFITFNIIKCQHKFQLYSRSFPFRYFVIIATMWLVFFFFIQLFYNSVGGLSNFHSESSKQSELFKTQNFWFDSEKWKNENYYFIIIERIA